MTVTDRFTPRRTSAPPVVVDGAHLTLDQVAAVARRENAAVLSADPAVTARIEAARDLCRRSDPGRGPDLTWSLLEGSSLAQPYQAVVDRAGTSNGGFRQLDVAIQDKYSLRCVPQFTGVLWDTLTWVERWLDTEITPPPTIHSSTPRRRRWSAAATSPAVTWRWPWTP